MKRALLVERAGMAQTNYPAGKYSPEMATVLVPVAGGCRQSAQLPQKNANGMRGMAIRRCGLVLP
jgi:hypothetical protein